MSSELGGSGATWDHNVELFIETGRLARLGGWELDVVTQEVRWSPVLFEIFELPGGAPPIDFSRSSPLLDDALALYHPDDRPLLVASLEQAVEHGVPYDLELRVITARGNLIHVRTTGRPVVEDGNVARVWGALQDVTDRVEREAALVESVKVLRDAYSHTIEVLVNAIEARDPYTAFHQRNVSQFAAAIATSLGLPADRIEGLRFGGMLHDIGKIAVPLEILNRPGKLSALEHELIKSHAQVGAEILSGVDYPWPVIDIVRHHHERIDGSGYPDGLRGDEISMEARIVAVADVVEAMSSDRPYRAALGLDKALEEIVAHRGMLYDADVVDACVRLFEEKEFEFERW